MNSIKTKKIGSSIQKALMEIIFDDAKDSLLKSITITACDVNKDLSLCKVYFTVLNDCNHKEIEKWRLKESLRLTAEIRPDLLADRELSEAEKKLLEEIEKEKNNPR